MLTNHPNELGERCAIYIGESQCALPSESQLCHCGRYHALGRIHYGYRIQPVCYFHGNREIARVQRLTASALAPKLNKVDMTEELRNV